MQQGSIFEDQVNEPLASRLRPENLEQVFGHSLNSFGSRKHSDSPSFRIVTVGVNF